MKSSTSILITATLLFAAPANPSQLAAQEHTRYKLIDLGTLGGPNSYLPLLPPYHDFLPTPSLSQGGIFAGYADTSDTDPYCFNEDCYVSHAIAWRHGVRTDLGTLPGAPGSNSAATWISKNGVIAGLSENGQIDPLTGFPSIFAVLWRKGQIANLGTLEGGYNSAATAVNNAGQVVGLATNTIPDANSLVGSTTETRAFLWEHEIVRDLGTLPGGTDAMALFINERGQVVGQSYSANSIVPPPIGCADSPLTLYGFFWDKGKMTDIGTLGGSCAFPYSLNNRGEVVGQSNIGGDVSSHPFLWRSGKKMKDLGALGGNYGFAEWLNDYGTIVGSATNAGDQALLAFQWKDGTMTNLETLEGNACSAADAINSQGLIVGGSGFNAAPFFPACTDLVEHAVLWDRGQIIDLDNFVPPGYDLTLNEAFFINDHGEIGGVGTLSNGNLHAFVLVPCGSDDTGCQDAVAGPAFRPAPATTRPANNQNNPIRRMLRQRLGSLYQVPVPATSSGSSMPGSAIGAPAAEDGATKTGDSLPNLLDGADPISRFRTAWSCAEYGRPCSLNGGHPHCCGTLKCVFHGGSTRVGYMCE